MYLRGGSIPEESFIQGWVEFYLKGLDFSPCIRGNNRIAPGKYVSRPS
jgi:hypothetical protein